ncbi:TonB family protein [Burkholderia cepacia]|uniref:TonB family protein n=1 Tax=Burkholderia cepacia TaxID=292 RepID=UPI002AB6047D|nr:TonB family protein [Burkholderia cepacia]
MTSIQPSPNAGPGPVLVVIRPVRPGRAAGTVVSFALHGAVLALVWTIWSRPPVPPPRERTIELTIAPRVQPLAVPQPPAAPKPVPAPPQAHTERSAPARRVLTPAPARSHTVAPPTSVSPHMSSVKTVDAAPAAPSVQPAATESTPAPAPVPAQAQAHTVGMSGIPTDYAAKVYERINRYASDGYPRSARLRREEGRIAYRLTLDADGRIVRVDITPSGSDDLDAAARDAIRAAAPFPKPPDLGASTYQLAGAIVYQLTD